MTRLIQRMKSGLRHVGEWISGHDVPVADEPLEAERIHTRPTRRPAVDVYESQDELRLVADVPGSLPDTTQVHVSQGQLTVLAQTGAAPDAPRLLGDDADADWYVAFAVPRDVEGKGARASHRDGVLTVWLPKGPRPEPRRIPVRAI